MERAELWLHLLLALAVGMIVYVTAFGLHAVLMSVAKIVSYRASTVLTVDDLCKLAAEVEIFCLPHPNE